MNDDTDTRTREHYEEVAREARAHRAALDAALATLPKMCPRCHALSDTKDTCSACRKVIAAWRPAEWWAENVRAARRGFRTSL